MRLLVFTVLVAVATASAARAGDSDGTGAAAQARALAKDATRRAAAGDYQEALVLFRKSLALAPQVETLCNIGAAYFELDRWPETHLFLAACLRHAGELEARYIAKMSRAFAFAEKQLERGGFARVELIVEPRDATVTIAAIASGEPFVVPGVVWLPLGSHRVQVDSPGYQSRTVPLEVDDDDAAPRLEVSLEKQPEPDTAAPRPQAARHAVEPPAPAPTEPLPTSGQPEDRVDEPSRLGAYVVLAAAGGALIGGVGFHLAAVGTREELEPLPDSSERDDKVAELERERLLMVGFYGASAIAAGIGTYLWIRASRSAASTSGARARVGAAIGPTSAGVWLRWEL